ncbi:hypothetical protein PIB30_032980 [Stylosanthes scabra]|uniref:Retrotransposon Copia-like N-terminal domain-containing protein n=1 Tax=Stylosanthes scabra TaxID=79078 RepID=A0ABU6SC33_9FABA|nr:hypothetical protein [Stylosanthes scabra]
MEAAPTAKTVREKGRTNEKGARRRVGGTQNVALRVDNVVVGGNQDCDSCPLLIALPLSWYPELAFDPTMALITSSQLKIKNGLIPLSDKLDEDNFSTWRKSVLLTIKTLELQDHLDLTKAPEQFEELPSSNEKDTDSTSKSSTTEGDSTKTVKKTASSTPIILQESEKFTEWQLLDSALMTWLDASMILTYKKQSSSLQIIC